MGTPNAGGMRLSTNNRLYLENGKNRQFLLKPNKKLYALYRMVTLPITSSDR